MKGLNNVKGAGIMKNIKGRIIIIVLIAFCVGLCCVCIKTHTNKSAAIQDALVRIETTQVETGTVVAIPDTSNICHTRYYSSERDAYVHIVMVPVHDRDGKEHAELYFMTEFKYGKFILLRTWVMEMY